VGPEFFFWMLLLVERKDFHCFSMVAIAEQTHGIHINRNRIGSFHSARLAGLVFTGVPFAVTGGILALLLRGCPSP
jgi:hypothetical protein